MEKALYKFQLLFIIIIIILLLLNVVKITLNLNHMLSIVYKFKFLQRSAVVELSI